MLLRGLFGGQGLVDAMRARNAVALFLEELSPRPAKALARLGCFRVGAVTRFMAKAGSSSSVPVGDAGKWFVTRADSDSDVPHHTLPLR